MLLQEFFYHRAGGQNLCGLGAGDCGQDWECEGPLVTFEKQFVLTYLT